jgi:hypothetical protein
MAWESEARQYAVGFAMAGVCGRMLQAHTLGKTHEQEEGSLLRGLLDIPATQPAVSASRWAKDFQPPQSLAGSAISNLRK